MLSGNMKRVVIEVADAWQSERTHSDLSDGHCQLVELQHTSYCSEREGIDAEVIEILCVVEVLHCTSTDWHLTVGHGLQADSKS